ncbi:MAG TPA: carbohydrate ABC transporter permease [Anaerovoracaceae bacterium]|nr:carbohydrate ABC transporter permease [Anaerovoracaceae bacterium]
MNRKNQSLLSIVLSQVLMISITIMIIFPLYYMFSNALKHRQDYIKSTLSFPVSPTLQNFIDAFHGKDFTQWFLNTTILSFVSSGLTLLIAFFAAYAFAKLDFPGKKFLFRLIIPLMSVPPVAMIIPQFQMIKSLGLINSLASVILIYIGIMLPMTIYLYRNFMVTIPDSLLEAAQIDGCSRLRALWVIVMPLTLPAMITSTLVNLVWAWNELLIALVFLQDNSLRTLMVGVTLFKSRFTLNIPVIMAGLAIVSIPLIIIYVIAQKKLVEGLLSGSMKE